MNDDIAQSGFTELSARVSHLETRFTTLSVELSENTQATKRVESNTADIVEAVKAMAWVGKIAKPMSYIVAIGAACAGAWASFKAGVSVK